MHEFNFKFFTEIGKANNRNVKTVFIKFFSGHLSVFKPEFPINEVHTTISTPSHICTVLLSLGFAVEAVSTDEIIWRKL